MNTLLLLASFGIGAVSALSGRTLAKWLILGFIAAFIAGTVLSPVITLPDIAQIAYGLMALGTGLIVLLGYKPAKTTGIVLMLLAGLLLGLVGQQDTLFLLGQLVWLIMALISGFILINALREQNDAAWVVTVKRIVGVCIIAAVPGLFFSGLDEIHQTSPETADGGAILYTGNEQSADHPQILESLISAVYFAFNADGESAVYDRLALAVDGPLLADLYLQQRRSHLLSETEGAEVTVDAVELLKAELASNAIDGRGISFKANWQASGSVSHSKHEHERINRYEAVVSIAPVEGNWKIIALELLDEQRTVEESDHEEDAQ